MNWNKKSPKLKKGAWFVKVRGSYLPMTPQGWLMHALLVGCAVVAIYMTYYYDDRALVVVLPALILQLVGIGAIFTWVASKKA
jgi:hypothetical protein